MHYLLSFSQKGLEMAVIHVSGDYLRYLVQNNSGIFYYPENLLIYEVITWFQENRDTDGNKVCHILRNNKKFYRQLEIII